MLSITFLFVVILSNPQVEDSQHESALPTAEAIRNVFRTLSRSIQSLDLEYIASHKVESPRDDDHIYVLRAFNSGGDVLFSFGHGRGKHSWKEDPYLVKYILIDDDYHTLYPRQRVYIHKKLTSVDSLPPKIGIDIFCMATGWWPYSRNTDGFFIEDMPLGLKDLSNRSDYVVKKRDRPRGYTYDCILYELPGRDRLWLDDRYNFSIVLRELSDRDGNLLVRLTAREHVLDVGGIWMPSSLSRQVFRSIGKGKDEPATLVAKVTKIRINTPILIRDEVVFPPGTLVVDPKTSTHEQKVGGGFDLLNLYSDTIRRVTGNKGDGASRQSQDHRIIATITGLLIATIVYIVFRKLRARRGIAESIPMNRGACLEDE